MGVPVIRIIVYWGLYWGPLISGNYQISYCSTKHQETGSGSAQRSQPKDLPKAKKKGPGSKGAAGILIRNLHSMLWNLLAACVLGRDGAYSTHIRYFDVCVFSEGRFNEQPIIRVHGQADGSGVSWLCSLPLELSECPAQTLEDSGSTSYGKECTWVVPGFHWGLALAGIGGVCRQAMH